MLTLSAILAALISLIIIVALCYVCFWLIDAAFPEPIRLVAKIIVGVIGLVGIVQYVVPILGLH